MMTNIFLSRQILWGINHVQQKLFFTILHPALERYNLIRFFFFVKSLLYCIQRYYTCTIFGIYQQYIYPSKKLHKTWSHETVFKTQKVMITENRRKS